MKCIVIILLVVFCCTLSDIASAMSNIDLEFSRHTWNQTNRDGNACVSWYGCWNKFCWVGCEHLGYRVGYGEWCYSAPPGFKRQSYKKCKTKSDCSECWGCTSNCNRMMNF